MRNGEAKRAASVWVAGVGAVLLFVAAALFVAVQWKNLPDEAKLGIILALTAVAVVGGRRLKRTLPATGSVLFHLGAFLLPIDLGAVDLHLGLPWQQLLLAEGILGVAAFSALRVLEDSRTLRIAASVSVVATALGVGANTPVPAAVALALAAAAMFVYRPGSRTALVFATVAGYLPVFALPFVHIDVVPRVIAEAGLPKSGEPIGALVAGVLSCIVLFSIAYAEERVGFALIGFGAAIVTGSTAFIAASLPRTAATLTPFGVFLAIEVIRYALRRDPFWTKPVRWLASTAEVAVAAPTLASLVYILGQFRTSPIVDHTAAAALALLAAGWVLAAYTTSASSRDDVLWRVLAVAGATSAVASVSALSYSPWPTIVALTAFGGALLEAAYPLTDTVGVAFLVWSAFVSGQRTPVGMVPALVATAVIVRSVLSGSRTRRAVLVSVTTLVLGLGAAAEATHISDFVAVLAFVGAAWAVAIAVDFCEGTSSLIPRSAALFTLALTPGWTSNQRMALAAVLAGQFAFDAVRLRAPVLLYGTVIPTGVLLFDAGLLAGLHVAFIGVVLSVSAVVWIGLSAVVDEEWRDPFRVAAAAASLVGFALSSLDIVALGIVLMVCGATVFGTGLLERVPVLSAIGGALVVSGVIAELAGAHVTTVEAYVAPVALYLTVAGMVARRRSDVSSWRAYAPTIAFAGGIAFLERVLGGPGWHAVAAGAVGVVAVAGGGYRRLAGPLFTGTALLAAVVVFESMAVMATVPTWGWFALAGAALLSTGIALERSEVSPVAAGRRVVDTIAANFS